MLSRSNHKVKVFIADDSLIVREHLVTMLDELVGIEIVGQAGTVAKAISAIGKLQPDMVILDIRMPGGSGIDVLQRVKQDEPAPVVIILTNYPYPAYRQKCLQAGADFFLDKSTEFDQTPELFERYKQAESLVTF
jgi:DNA-binding NarL/FixJ family response regulator